jgi:hypothetical protein
MIDYKILRIEKLMNFNNSLTFEEAVKIIEDEMEK